MPAHIVRALPSDAPELAKLLERALPPGWPVTSIAVSCSDTNRAVLKAVDGALLIGFAILQFAADEAEILTIATLEEARRQGIASLLMEAAIALCRERAISNIYLEVAEGNGPAQGLYKKFGFRPCGRRKNYYRSPGIAPESALIMRLDTSPGLSQIAPGKGGIS